jgi:hypothetical protein
MTASATTQFTEKIFEVSMELLEAQELNNEIDRTLRGRDSPSNMVGSLERIVCILERVPDGFSVGYLSSELMKLLMSCVPLEQPTDGVASLLRLLTSRFRSSFRPGGKEVMSLIKSTTPSGFRSLFPRLLELFINSVRNLLSNPKSAFLLLSDEFLPFVAQVDSEIIAENIRALHSAVSMMFTSTANIECLSSLLRSEAQDVRIENDCIRKKRRMSSTSEDVYVSRLFSGLRGNYTTAKIVLSEYVGSGRRSDDGDDFKLFMKLLSCLDLHGRISLWKHMANDLRMYRVRDESADLHKSSLLRIFEEGTAESCDDKTFWFCAQVVLEIDPWNFMDAIMEKLAFRLPDNSVEFSSCMCVLFGTFAVKGSFCEIASKMCDISTDKSYLNSARFLIDSDALKNISGMDLTETIRKLVDTIIDSGEPEGKRACAQVLLEPLLEAALHKVPENLREDLADSLQTSLSTLIGQFKEDKKRRSALSRLMIYLVDALRVVHIAHTFPLVTTENTTSKMQVMEAALDLIARKSSDYRPAALVRLTMLFGTEASISEIGMEAISEFIGSNPTNAYAVVFRFKTDPDWPEFVRFGSRPIKAFPEQLMDPSVRPRKYEGKEKALIPVIESDDPIGALLVKSKQLMAQYPREIYTPVSVRRVSSRSDILSLEFAWANQLSDLKMSVNRLIGMIERPEALYGLTVLIEECRREKRPYLDFLDDTILSKARLHISLAQARFFAALSNTPLVTGEMLIQISTDILSQDSRDRPAVDAAFWCLLQGILTGVYKGRVRLPWWTSKMHTILVAVRGLLGSCISGDSEETQKEAARYVARIWKTLVDSVATEKMFRISKSVLAFAGDFIRLSHKITNGESLAILERGCCVLLNKLQTEEKQHLHALLGKIDREILKRIVELLERDFKYRGKS